MAERDPDVEILEDDEDQAEDGHAGLPDDEGGGDEPGEGEDAPDEGEEGQIDAAPERKPGRAERAVLEAKKSAREASARADKLDRELSELRAERQQARAESPEQEAAKLSLMTAEERMDYKLAKAEQNNARQIAVIQFQSADNSDKAAFEAKGAYDPRYKKYGPEVEQVLARERRNGQNYPRETILKFVLGEKVMANQKTVQKQKDAGKRNIARQQTQPDNSRSDRSAPRARAGSGNDVAALERRLENVEL